MSNRDHQYSTPDRQTQTCAKPRVEMRRLSVARASLPERATSLPNSEQAEAARYLRSDDRDRFLLGRLLLRDMVAKETGLLPGSVPLTRDANGRPCISQHDGIDINLSHSGDLVAAAIGRGIRVGIDVEYCRTNVDIDAVGRQVFTSSERAFILATGHHAAAAFFTQWTLKEALVKALGCGFLDDPRRIEIRHSSEGRFLAVFVAPGQDDVDSGWTLEKLECGDAYTGALAFRRCSGHAIPTHARTADF